MFRSLRNDNRLNVIKKDYPDADISYDDVIVVDNTSLFTKKQLVKALSVSESRIRQYEQVGMPRSKYSSSKLALYELNSVIDWIVNNIDLTKSKRQQKKDELAVEEELEHDWDYRKKRADALKTEHQARKEELGVLELKKVLVRKDEIDKAMADLGATMSSFYRNDLKALPVLLENKTYLEIKDELDRHYKDRINDMRKIVEKEVGDEEDVSFALDKLYDFIKEKIS